jgi:organic radical activating enzyme
MTAQKLPIMESFFTIQGEGFYSGRAAYFIRLAGCDVGCTWCDVKESWDELLHPSIAVENIVNEAVASNCDFVVITGGEPALHDLTKITELLRENGIEIAIETSGTALLKGKVDWYCFSPKKFKAPIEEAYFLASELKVIINHPSDIAWAETHAEKVNSECKLFLQPEWEKRERFLPIIVDYIKSNPKWLISLQTHKYMNIP